MDDQVIGLNGGPLDGERRVVDTVDPTFSETLSDGTVATYRYVGTGHNVGRDPMVETYTYIEP